MVIRGLPVFDPAQFLVNFLLLLWRDKTTRHVQSGIFQPAAEGIRVDTHFFGNLLFVFCFGFGQWMLLVHVAGVFMMGKVFNSCRMQTRGGVQHRCGKHTRRHGKWGRERNVSGCAKYRRQETSQQNSLENQECKWGVARVRCGELTMPGVGNIVVIHWQKSG